MSVGPKTQESRLNECTPGGSPATPQKLAQEVRDSPYFYVGSTRTNPNNLLTHWCPLALIGPTPQSTSDRLHTQHIWASHPRSTTDLARHTSTHRPHTHRSLGFGPTPPKCARAQEIADPALIPNVGPKTRRVGPTGRTPRGNPATPQKLAQEVRDSPHFYVGSTLPPQPMWD